MADRFYFGELQHPFVQALFRNSVFKAAIERAGIFKDMAGNQVLLATGEDMAAALRNADEATKTKLFAAGVGIQRHDSQNSAANGGMVTTKATTPSCSMKLIEF